MNQETKTIFENTKKYTKQHKKDKCVLKAIQLSTGKVITLCGSTDYKFEFDRANKLLTLAGNVVLSCGVFKKEFSDIEDYRDTLECVHKRKIDMSDMVFVINIDNHIGTHTASEISYAIAKHKDIKYLYDNGEKVL